MDTSEGGSDLCSAMSLPETLRCVWACVSDQWYRHQVAGWSCTAGCHFGQAWGNQQPFMSWTNAHSQICLKGKGNFLLTAYSLSKHLVKALFIFYYRHYGEEK